MLVCFWLGTTLHEQETAQSGQFAQTSNLLFPGPGKSKMVQTSNLLFPGPGKSKMVQTSNLLMVQTSNLLFPGPGKSKTARLPICFFPAREKAKWFRLPICFFPSREKAKWFRLPFCFFPMVQTSNGSDFQFGKKQNVNVSDLQFGIRPGNKQRLWDSIPRASAYEPGALSIRPLLSEKHAFSRL